MTILLIKKAKLLRELYTQLTLINQKDAKDVCKLSGNLKIESKVDDCFYEAFVDGLFIKFRPEKNYKDK